MAGNILQIRDRDWLFSALWTTASSSTSSLDNEISDYGRDSEVHESDTMSKTKETVSARAKRCYVRIPLIFLFRDGMPIKAIQSSSAEGFIERVSPESATTARRKDLNQSALKVMRNKLQEYQLREGHLNNRFSSSSSSTSFCTVIYLDGEREHFTSDMLDTLLLNQAWRHQILLLQSSVPSNEDIIEGFYSTSSSALTRTRVVSESVKMANHLTHILVQAAEKAYSSEERKEAEVSVHTLESQFVRDSYGRLVFLFAGKILVSYKKKRILAPSKGTSSPGKQADRSLEAAASALALDLQGLICHAQKKGVPINDSFLHFDIVGGGFVDLNMLLDGLARLGIGAVQPVAELLLMQIGGLGASFFTLSDLKRFVKIPEDVRILLESKSNDEADKLSSKLSTAVSLRQTRMKILETNRMKSAGSTSATFPQMDDGKKDTPLPLPLEAYTHGLEPFNWKEATKGNNSKRCLPTPRRHRVVLHELSKAPNKRIIIQINKSNSSSVAAPSDPTFSPVTLTNQN